MKSLKKNLWLPFAILMLAACSSAPEEKKIAVFKKINKEISLNNIGVDRTKSIYLQPDSGFLVGEVNKIDWDQNQIVILDNEITKCLFVFDSTGKPEYKIPFGEGRTRQAVDVCDFSMYNNRVYLLDQKLKRLFVYEKESGRQLNVIDLPVSVDAVIANRDGIFLYRNRPYYKKDKLENASFIQLDTAGVVKNTFLKTTGAEDYLGYTAAVLPLTTCGEKIFISRTFDNKVYKYENGQFSTVCEFDLGKRKIPDEVKKLGQDEMANTIIKNKYAFVLDGFFENDSISFCRIMAGGNHLVHFIQMKAGGKKYVSPEIINKFSDVPFVGVNAINETGMASVLTPSVLLSLKQSIQSDSLRINLPGLYTLLNPINAESCNPVVQIAYFKNH